MWINFPNPVAVANGKEVEAKKVKQAIYKARQQEIQSTVSEERWQGKLIKNRWDDEEVKLNSLWKNAPTTSCITILLRIVFYPVTNLVFVLYTDPRSSRTSLVLKV